MKNNLIINMNKIIYTILIFVLIVSCSKSESRKPIKRNTGSFMNESIERNIKLNNLEEEILQIKMQNDSTNTYYTSPNGFWYFYNKKDALHTKLPIKGDEVIFSYEIKTVKDSILYSKKELGDKKYLVDKEELITGLQDGIKIMHEGDIVTFLFPSHKAFGYTGNDRVYPNEPLIYTVHLKKIINKN